MQSHWKQLRNGLTKWTTNKLSLHIHYVVRSTLYAILNSLLLHFSTIYVVIFSSLSFSFRRSGSALCQKSKQDTSLLEITTAPTEWAALRKALYIMIAVFSLSYVSEKRKLLNRFDHLNDFEYAGAIFDSSRAGTALLTFTTIFQHFSSFRLTQIWNWNLEPDLIFTVYFSSRTSNEKILCSCLEGPNFSLSSKKSWTVHNADLILVKYRINSYKDVIKIFSRNKSNMILWFRFCKSIRFLGKGAKNILLTIQWIQTGWFLRDD